MNKTRDELAATREKKMLELTGTDVARMILTEHFRSKGYTKFKVNNVQLEVESNGKVTVIWEDDV